MAKKLTIQPEPKKRDAILLALRYKGDKPDEALAYYLTKPEVQAAVVIQQFEGTHEVNALIGELTEQVKAVNGGDMRRPEAMLVAQAHTLNEIFNNLVRRSSTNLNSGYLDAGERYMRLALKTQSQCRTTLESLAEIKNPRAVAFVKQANIAHGHQQVNNGTPPAHAGETINQPNELSGSRNELLPDARASQAASRVDTSVEALGEIHGAAHA